MNNLRKKIFEILQKNKDGLTREQLISILEEKTGREWARTTVYDNLPHAVINKVHIGQARGRPYVKFKLKPNYESFMNEDYP